MSKEKDNRYAGVEDFTPKKNTENWGVEEYYREPTEEIKPRNYARKPFMTKRTLLRILCLFAGLALLVVVLKSFLPNTGDTAEEQLYKMVKAHTDRDYKLVGGLGLKGKDLWLKLGEINTEKYESLSIVGQQDFADDVIAACHKAISEESVKIGDKTYSTQKVSADTVTAWLRKIQSSERTGIGDKLWETFLADPRPAFIPAYSGLTRQRLALIALVIFVVICIFFPKKPYSRSAGSHRRGRIG